VINVNCLDNRATFIQQPVPVDHDGETFTHGAASGLCISRAIRFGTRRTVIDEGACSR
jgi:hypothetical protein